MFLILVRLTQSINKPDFKGKISSLSTVCDITNLLFEFVFNRFLCIWSSYLTTEI